MINVKLGQDVWIRPGGLYKNEGIKKKKVIKIGSKYITIDDIRETKYHKKDGWEKNDTNYKSKLYLTLQEIVDEDESEILYNEIRNKFTTLPQIKLSLYKLRQIYNIIMDIDE